MKGSFLALAFMASCPSYTGRTLVVDTRDHSAEIHWVLVGEAASDLEDVIRDYLEGDELEKSHPAWTLTDKRLEPVGADLHGVAQLQWTHLGDVGFLRAARPGYAQRFCPPAKEVVTSANAHARTPSGCVLWKPGVKILRVETMVRPHSDESSLLPWYQRRADPSVVGSTGR